jgi:hypothetical protein
LKKSFLGTGDLKQGRSIKRPSKTQFKFDFDFTGDYIAASK